MTAAQWGEGITALRFVGATLSLLVLLNAAPAQARNPMKIPDSQYEPVTWAQIDGWANDDHDAAFAAFLKSCNAILSGSPEQRPGRPIYAGLHKVCQKAVTLNPQKPGEARTFFEQNFRPVRISQLGTSEGFLTGYYEPIVEGRRDKVGSYSYPLYRKPHDLLPGGRMAILAAASHGKKKARRKLVAYHDRAAIDDGGALAGRDLEICWLKDPIDSFFAQIQGSVRVVLDDGKLLRLNYAAANGQPYYAVGRWLIDQKIIAKDDMSMDRIREWMTRNPEAAKELRRKNKSYVFFRETNLPSNEEPIGAQGVSLTPGRSIAVDHKLHVYGTPFFISAYLPINSLKPDTWFRRLMIAQDTGGAIVGPARADLYFGAGDEAESLAGRMRHYGTFVMLVPKPVEGAGEPEAVPLPLPRPEHFDVPVAETEPSKATPAVATPKVTATIAPAGAAAEVNEAPAKDDAAKPAARDGDKREKKAAAHHDKKQHEKSAKEEKAGKAAKAKSKTEIWESRVMPKLAPDPPAKTSRPKNRT